MADDLEYLKRKKFLDSDDDTLDDTWERDVGRHNNNNKPLHPLKHINIAGTLSSVNGIVAIHHDNLDNTINHIEGKEERKLCLTVTEPKKMSLSLKIRNPSITGFDIKKIKIPVAEMDDARIQVNNGTFDENRVNKRIYRILKKKKVRR